MGAFPLIPAGNLAETTGHAKARFEIGGYFMDGSGSLYRYVKFHKGVGAVAGALGGVVHWKSAPDAATPEVTSDVSDSLSASGLLAAGVMVMGASAATGEFIFVMVKGIRNCKVPAATAIGDHMVGGTVDLEFARVASGTAPGTRCYGHALEAVANGEALCAVDFLQ